MSKETVKNPTLARAIEHFGGHHKMAKDLRVSFHTIVKWEQTGRVSPMGARMISLMLREPRSERKLLG